MSESSEIKDAMLTQEITNLRTKLAAAQREFDNLDILVSGGVIRIRQLVDPYESEVTKLDVDGALEAMTQLKINVHRMRELLDTINRIKKALGQ